MNLTSALHIVMASLITKTIVNGHENTRSLSTIEEAIGDGCRNSFSFYGRFITSERKECFSSALCEGNNFNSVFMPKKNGICVKFSEEDVDCNVLEVVTTFQEPWSMKYVTLKASDMDATHDPQDITFLASHDAVQWDELHKNNVHFSERGEIVEFIFNNENNYKHYSILVKGRNKLMNVGHYGLVQAYTKSCAAQLFTNITGDMIPYFTTQFNYNWIDEDYVDTGVLTFLTTEQVQDVQDGISAGKTVTVETDVQIDKRRDDSWETNTFVEYIDLDSNQIKVWKANDRVPDHLYLKFGSSYGLAATKLRCHTKTQSKYRSCLPLARNPGNDVDAGNNVVLIKLRFDPRDGFATNNQWIRNRFTLTGTHYRVLL